MNAITRCIYQQHPVSIHYTSRTSNVGHEAFDDAPMGTKGQFWKISWNGSICFTP
jgi:hypothetical protein